MSTTTNSVSSSSLSSSESSSSESAFSLFRELAFSSRYADAPDIISNTTESIERFASSDVLLLMARLFLIDEDVLQLGRCNHATLRSMHGYDLRMEVKLIEHLMKYRWEWNEIMNGMTNEQKQLLLAAASMKGGKKQKKQKKGQHDNGDSAVPTSSATFQPRSSEYAIGRVCRLVHTENPVTEKYQFLFSLLHLLPSTIKLVSIACKEIRFIPRIRPGLIAFRMEGNSIFPLTELKFPESVTQILISRAVKTVAKELPASLILPSRLRILHLRMLSFAPTMTLPQTLKTLTLGPCAMEEEIEKLILPDGLRNLRFWDGFNTSIDHLHLPSHLRHLDLGQYFAQPLRDWNPPLSLRSFLMPGFFLPGDQLRLPPSLREWKFENDYNAPLDGIIWPSKLKKLALGTRWNRRLVGVTFPETLTSLSFGSHYYEPLSKLDWTPPPNLRTLLFSDFHLECHQLYLGETLKKLHFAGNYFTSHLPHLILPQTLEHLKITAHGGWGNKYPHDYTMVIDELESSWFPSSLKLIEVDSTCVQAWRTLEKLPKDCEVMQLKVEPSEYY